jgi:S-DNA-T family DNA segregation ATPase FtsK/SpoIIIE
MTSPVLSAFDLQTTNDLLPPLPVAPEQSPVAAVPAAPSARTGRDVQRGALRDLIALAADCATTESDIEREYRTSKEQAVRTLSDRGFEIDQRHQQQQEETNQKHQARLAELASQYKAERNKIAAADKAGKKKIEDERASIEEKLKKKYDHALWLAESVLEVANGQAGAAFKEKNAAVQNAQEELNGFEVHAAGLVQQYGVTLPTDDVIVEDDPNITVDADAAFATHRGTVEQLVARLGKMPIANLFVGGRPYFLAVVLEILAVAGVQFYYKDPMTPQWQPLGIFAGGLLGLMIVVGIVLRVMATRQVRAVHTPIRESLHLARAAADQQMVNAGQTRQVELQAALTARNTEVQSAKDQVSPIIAKALQARTAGLTAVQMESAKQLARIDKIRDASNSETDEWLRRQLHDLDHKRERDLKENKVNGLTRDHEIEDRYKQRKTELEQRWGSGLTQIQAPIDRDGEALPSAFGWNDPAWNNWMPSKKFASRVGFGEMQVNLKAIAENVPQKLELPATFSLPAVLAFPAQASLLIHSDHAGRPDAIRALQMVMARLLTSLPAGRVRFTIIDPVGLGQNFAGFMHLSDYDDALVGGRIWTSQDQIDQKLANLAEHMETVIQKYLRNEFETIDDYNAQAGELAEPYRFLVIADLPTNFSADAFRRLNSIASSGARCGVYTLISRDTRGAIPAGSHLDELKAHSVNLIRKDDRFVWDDEVFRQLPFTFDAPPTEDQLTKILHKVGAGAKEAKRVEVPFAVIAPGPGKMWTGSTSAELDVMVGRLGANRFQSLKLGKGTSQHVLIAGKTGSGKSTLMHAMITNSALWYSPDEVELYLVDFKKGVEFKTYAEHLLPHARAIAVESDREFGLSLLTRLDVELARRGEIFRKAGVQDLISYRQTTNPQVVPRTLLIIDEFQEFFTEDDKLAQEAALLIERLVRQGRAFGMHVLLGSQTIGGAGGLPRAVLGQFAVRIALQTTEADSQLILGDNNSAARLLSRPGEAIYNDAGGAVEGNSPFQVAYLSDKARDVYLADLASKAEPYFKKFGYPIVFEGNAAADIRRNIKLMTLLDAPRWPALLGSAGALGWVGEPIAIKDPTAISFRRQSGANVLIVGQADEQSTSLVCAIMVSIAAQQSPSQASIVMLDGTPSDSNFFGTFEKVKAAVPLEVKMIDFRATGDAVDEIAQEVARRQESDAAGPSIYMIVYGLQRYRALRKQEDDFSFSTSDEPKKPNPGKQFAEILREGPGVGVHVIVWADTLVSIDRTFERGMMREFDNRVLFQMSAADSSNLIDSPNANKLGFHKALVYSEEQGVMERFRPYAMPDTEWLIQLKQKLSNRAV